MPTVTETDWDCASSTCSGQEPGLQPGPEASSREQASVREWEESSPELEREGSSPERGAEATWQGSLLSVGKQERQRAL